MFGRPVRIFFKMVITLILPFLRRASKKKKKRKTNSRAHHNFSASRILSSYGENLRKLGNFSLPSLETSFRTDDGRRVQRGAARLRAVPRLGARSTAVCAALSGVSRSQSVARVIVLLSSEEKSGIKEGRKKSKKVKRKWGRYWKGECGWGRVRWESSPPPRPSRSFPFFWVITRLTPYRPRCAPHSEPNQ